MQQASISLVLASGMTFAILTASIDLPVGSVFAAPTITGLIVSLDPTLSQLAIPAALACELELWSHQWSIGCIFSATPFIVTLGGLTATGGIARLMGSDTTVFNSNLSYSIVGNGSLFGVPILVIIALATVLVSWFILRRTVLGVHIYAIGGNPNAAWPTGIKVSWVLILVYTASGLLAGLGGVMASTKPIR
jgi:ribose transport system permease protein